MTPLPAPRTPGRYHVALVCLGNICRSPMAEAVLAARVADAGLADRVEVSSAGTGGWHVGDPMDERAAATLTAAGYDATRHRARRFDAGSLPDVDLVLVMDESNLSHVRAAVAQAGAEAGAEAVADTGDGGRIRLFRELDPDEPGGEVPDPYYGGPAGFEEVLTMVERTADAVVAELQRATASGTAAS